MMKKRFRQKNFTTSRPKQLYNDLTMRIVIQRVKEAHVSVEGDIVGQIEQGLMLLVAVHRDDTSNIIPYFAEKIPHLRLFPDDNDKMNRSLLEINGALLVVSQFTLYGDCKTGRRPSFTNSAPPEKAEALYQELVDALGKRVKQVETGIFGANMQVTLTNDGPVTLILE